MTITASIWEAQAFLKETYFVTSCKKIKPVSKYFPTASECYIKKSSLTLTLSTEENILASSDTPPMYIFFVKTGAWSFSSFTSINTLAVLPKRDNGKYT